MSNLIHNGSLLASPVRRLTLFSWTVAVISLLVVENVLAEAPIWPQFRGPHRTDISVETGLLQEWPEEGPRQIWKYDAAGIGYSGPSVVHDQLFIMGTRNDAEVLICLNSQTGQELWTSKIGEVYSNNWGDGPRGTPTVNGEYVYALGAQGNLICAQTADGTIIWKRTMQELGGNVPSWGFCESVLVDGDRVICTPGGKNGAIVALNKTNGETVWQSEDFTDGAQYASIIAVDHNNMRQYIQLTMEHLVGISVVNGDVLWTSEWPGNSAVVATPIFHEGDVYISSGYGAGCKLVRIGAGNEISDVYVNKQMKNHHGGVILSNGHVYGYSDGIGWLCQNLTTGEKMWNERSKLGKGAIAYADGRFYCLAEEDGQVVLIEASPDGWHEHGRFTLEPQTELRKPAGRIWTHPVIVNGRMYLRDQELVFCFDVKNL